MQSKFFGEACSQVTLSSIYRTLPYSNRKIMSLRKALSVIVCEFMLLLSYKSHNVNFLFRMDTHYSRVDDDGVEGPLDGPVVGGADDDPGALLRTRLHGVVAAANHDRSTGLTME